MSLERKLVDALRSKDKVKIEGVFKSIYEEYYKLIYFCVGNYLKNKEDIEDITSEVFYNFFNHLENIKSDGNIKYYLTTTAKNLSLNFLKKTKEIALDKYLDVNAKYEMEDNTLLYLVKLHLDEEEREIVIDHIMLDKSLRLIAKERNSNANTIKSKYRRAIQKLRLVLGGKRHV